MPRFGKQRVSALVKIEDFPLSAGSGPPAVPVIRNVSFMPQDDAGLAVAVVASKNGKRRRRQYPSKVEDGQARQEGWSLAASERTVGDLPNKMQTAICGNDNASTTVYLMSGAANASESMHVGHDTDRLLLLTSYVADEVSKAMDAGGDPDRLVPGPVTVQLKGLGRSIILMREPALLDYPKDAISTLDGFNTSAGIIVVLAQDADNVRRRCEEIRGKVKRGECAMGRDADGTTLNVIGFDVSTATSLQRLVEGVGSRCCSLGSRLVVRSMPRWVVPCLALGTS